MSINYNRIKRKEALDKARKLAKKFVFDKTKKSQIEKIAHRLEKNRKVCSCPMCCNPRHSSLVKGKEKLTIQERKQNELQRKSDSQETSDFD